MTDAADKTAFSPEVIAEVFGGEPASVEAPAETPASTGEAPATTLEPKATDRIAAAKRAELKAERMRQDLEARRRENEAEKAALAAEKEEIRLFQDDPLAYAAKKGWTQKEYKAHLEKLAGQYTPEAEADRKLSEHDRELKELKDKLAAKEAAEQESALRAQIQAAEKAASEAFIADITASTDKYPYLAQEFEESEAASLALSELRATTWVDDQGVTRIFGRDANGNLLTRVKAFEAKYGETPSHAVIAEHIDNIAKKRIDARARAATSWGRKDKAANEGSKPTLGQQDSTPPIKGSSPRTLSRTDTSQRAAAPRTTAWSQEQADEESLRILDRAMRR